MNQWLKGLGITVIMGQLAGCMTTEENGYEHYYSSTTYVYDSTRYPPQYYNDGANYRDYSDQSSTSNVRVPESYHVGATHSPVSHRNMDKDWVANQNPQNYTIEVADDEKAARVAGKLVKVPKNERMAEVQYEKQGRSYYKGLYGTYDNYEAAQKALQALPPDVQQGAGIKSWGNVQQNVR